MKHLHLVWYDLVWAVWLAWFLGFELFAIFSGYHLGTLSDTVWTVEGLNRQKPFDIQMWSDVHWAIAALVWGLFGWLSLHLPFGLLG